MIFSPLGMVVLVAATAAPVPAHGPRPELTLEAARAVTATSSVPVVTERMPRRRLGAAPQAPDGLYSAHQAEFYMSAQEIEWVRPGLNVTIDSLTIGADRKPVVEISFKDDLDQPLDRAGKQTPGPLSISFLLAWYDAASHDYIAYTVRTQKSPITNVSAVQASTDSGGTWTDLGPGRARYTFKTALPQGFDQTKTHTLAIQAYRNMTSIIEGKYYYSNVLHDFRPDGQAVSERWDAFETATCNSCHDQLGFHGASSRREVKMCVMCHNNTQSLDPDTGNVVDMSVMIHKIHNAHNLANGYTIIGHNQSVHDYSHILYPQDTRNCDTCHRETRANGQPLPQGHIWLTNPSRAACGSCHDDVDFTTGAGHVAGPAADDSACASCHVPAGEFEFDASIANAHTVPTRSAQLPGLSMAIIGVQNVAPGKAPIVTFRVTDKTGASVDPTTLNSCNFLFAGPTTEYTWYKRQACNNAASTTYNGDTAVTTFAASTALPADAAGTYALSADYYRNVTLSPAPAVGSASVRDAGMNPIAYVAVTDAQPMPRREIVSLEKCNACHDTLALHGGQRYKIEECVMCHHPNETDVSRRPAAAGLPESVHLKYMVHRIHTGHEIGRDYTIYGFGSNPINFNGVGYPGDLRNCAGCHITTSNLANKQNYDLPLEDGQLPTVTQRDFYTPTQPEAATCLSCHTSLAAAAHAYVNTAPFGEACASCHGHGHEFSVAKVHAR